MAEQMKPSGVEWIGDIPSSWNTKRIKYLAQLKGRIGWQGLTSDEYTDVGPFLITGVDFSNGGINWENCVHITEERWAVAPEIHIKNGDLLITKDGTVGKVAIVEKLQGKASLNSGVLLVKTSDDHNKKFLYWTLLSEEFWTWFRLKNAGNSTIVHLYQNDFAEFSYAFPDVTEQKAIADYLDKECAQIDSIAADLEKQIELLQQYKQSLITETVTKGLDKSVPMKDSGVEWIGEIPYDWKAIRFRYVFSLDKGLTITKEDLVDDGVPVISYGQVHAKTNTGTGINDSLIRYVPELYLGTDRQSLAYQGNYIFADTSEDLGGVGNCVFIDINGALFAGYHTIISRIKGNSSEYIPKYFSYLFLSDMWRDQLRSKVMGVKVYSISQKLLKDTSILLPPKIIQQAIADYLDEKCATINSILDDKQAQLKVIQQHKKSLIYEYVTGKKRVKEVQ